MAFCNSTPSAFIPSLNVANPAADISRVRAVIELPPSLPLNKRSWSCVFTLMTKSSDEFWIVPFVTPPSLKKKSPPSASKIM